MSKNYSNQEEAMQGYGGGRILEKRKSVTMDAFLEAAHLDDTIIDLLKRYDRDGDGHFSKNEVVDIIMDLRQEMNNNKHLGETNKILRRSVAAAIIFCILLLSSIFGLSYAQAILTAKMDIDPTSGVMTTPDGMHVVATDSFAYKVSASTDEASGAQCLHHTQLGDLIRRVVNGNTIIVEMLGTGSSGNNNTKLQKLSGSMQAEDGQICFKDTSGQEICATPSSDCAPTSDNGRRLTSDVATCLAVYSAYSSSMPTVFGYMVSGASICIRNSCPGDVYSTSPPIYAGTNCVCQCAVSSGVEFAYSWGTH